MLYYIVLQQIDLCGARATGPSGIITIVNSWKMICFDNRAFLFEWHFFFFLALCFYSFTVHTNPYEYIWFFVKRYLISNTYNIYIRTIKYFFLLVISITKYFHCPLPQPKVQSKQLLLQILLIVILYDSLYIINCHIFTVINSKI